MFQQHQVEHHWFPKQSDFAPSFVAFFLQQKHRKKIAAKGTDLSSGPPVFGTLEMPMTKTVESKLWTFQNHLMFDLKKKHLKFVNIVKFAVENQPSQCFF